jgi:catechol 2,3-dioxygenase-like lactoylglutathione lyase family enzyme
MCQMTMQMQQQMSVVTLAVADPARSRAFYMEGFGWRPVFETPEITFFQMNGFVLGRWLADALAADSGRPAPLPSGGFALAHNVPTAEDVPPAGDRLLAHGGRLLTPTAAPPHGGLRAYVADPDDHAWEIAWNPAWPIAADGRVTFGV